MAQSTIQNPWSENTFATYLKWIEVVSKVAASENKLASGESVAAAANKQRLESAVKADMSPIAKKYPETELHAMA